MSKIRVLVAEDHEIMRKDIVNILRDAPMIEVVGEAENGWLAVELVRELQPDVVVMDINMPEINGIEATRQIIEDNSCANILMFTVSADGKDLVEALKAGARGYLLKDADPHEIVASIENVNNGECVVSRALAADLMEEFKELGKYLKEFERLRDIVRQEKVHIETKLTERELEVLRLLAEGLNNREIGDKLYASAATVKNHVSNILAKLRAQNRIQLAVIAVKEGLV